MPIDVIVRGVKSGYPFTVALGLVAKEMSDPIGTEFGMTSDEISFGSDIGAALDNLYHRVGHEDLLYLTMAIKIQTQTGGNLAEILVDDWPDCFGSAQCFGLKCGRFLRKAACPPSFLLRCLL